MKKRPRERVLYVGKSVSLRNRLQQHKMADLIERDFPGRDADVIVRVWLVDRPVLHRAESALIRRFRPAYNRHPVLSDKGWRIPAHDIEESFVSVRPETRRAHGCRRCAIPNFVSGCYAIVLGAPLAVRVGLEAAAVRTELERLGRRIDWIAADVYRSAAAMMREVA